jgi:hypothetical protein
MMSLSLYSSSQNHSIYAPGGLALLLPPLCRQNRHFPAVIVAVAAPVLDVGDVIAAGKPGYGGGAGGAAPGHGAGAAGRGDAAVPSPTAAAASQAVTRSKTEKRR